MEYKAVHSPPPPEKRIESALNSELENFTSKQTELKVQVHTSNYQKDLLVALGNINGPWAKCYILLSWPFLFEFSFRKP